MYLLPEPLTSLTERPRVRVTARFKVMPRVRVDKKNEA